MMGNHHERRVETPDADWVEQLAPAGEDPDAEADSSMPASIRADEVDADEADLVEGAIAVPLEDEYRADGR